MSEISEISEIRDRSQVLLAYSVLIEPQTNQLSEIGQRRYITYLVTAQVQRC